MNHWTRRAAQRWGLSLLLGIVWSVTTAADQIRLKDGTEFSGTLLGKDSDRVVVALPRSDVTAVNGEQLPTPVAAGAAAPAFTAVDLSGVTQALADYRGHVTLLQFWATWCPHCRADLALMKELSTQYQGKGLRILTVSVDQDINKLQSFIRDHALPYPVISVSGQPTSKQPSLPELYEMQGIPAYYLIDAQGTIAQTYAGSLTVGQRDLEGEIKRLLEALQVSASAGDATSQHSSRSDSAKSSVPSTVH